MTTRNKTSTCKKVWSYWEGTKPALVEDCLATWEKHLGIFGWEINVLTPETIQQFDIIKPESYDSLLPAHRADVIRLSLLYSHGGLWLDASIYLTENVDWLINKPVSICGVQYWKNNNPASYIENWILYSQPNNKAVLLWLETLNEILDTDPVTNHRAYNSPCVELDDYFMAYQAFCMLRKQHQEFEEIYQAGTKVTNDIFRFSTLKPLSKLPKEKLLVKFTSSGRSYYPFSRFPMIYIYLGIILVVALATILALRISRK